MRPIALVVTGLTVAGLLASAATAGPFGEPETLPPSVPVGYSVATVAAGVAPTSLDFAPDGSALYVAAVTGQVLRYPVVSPPGAPTVVGAPEVFADGFTQPLGVLATEHGVFVADKESNAQTNREDGLVWRLRDTDGNGRAEGLEREKFVRGLPNGRHNTNGMALGPGGALFIANGNSTDSGIGNEGGDPEIQPWSGSLLEVDPARTTPYACQWFRPGGGTWTVTGDCGGIEVAGTGWRNIYDVAFAPAGHATLDPAGTGRIALVPQNGPDGFEYAVPRPRAEDTLSVLDVADDEIEHFGFPWCLYDRNNGGLSGFAQDATGFGPCHPLPPEAFTGLGGKGVQRPVQALFGLHVSANGLAFDPATDELFVAEWGSLWNLDDGETPTGHKVVKVTFDGQGNADVTDFMTNVIPIDIVFAPDGSMWVADMAGPVYRVERLPLP